MDDPASERWQVSTNHLLYNQSELTNDSVCWRYRTASDRLADLEGDFGEADVIDVMMAISVEDWTMWSSVYNLTSCQYAIIYRRHDELAFHGQLAQHRDARK